MKYRRVVLGGTFDNLHDGHKLLIKTAVNIGEKIEIGITTDDFVKKKLVSSYKERLNVLKSYIRYINALNKVKILPLHDSFGITTTNPDIDAIIVSSETEPVAHQINKVRQRKMMRPLTIIRCKTVLAKDGKPISSSRIRKGEITPDGKIKGSVRLNIAFILQGLGSAYGYEVYQVYKRVIGDVSQRLVYYHLKKGEKDGYFVIDREEEVKGNYTWGGHSRRKYYRLRTGVNISEELQEKLNRAKEEL